MPNLWLIQQGKYMKVKSRIWYLEIEDHIYYNHVDDCLFFEGKKTDQNRNPIGKKDHYPFYLPYNVMKTIKKDDWLKVIDFYVDFESEKIDTELILPKINASEDQKILIGLKLDRFDYEKNKWSYIYEYISSLK